MASRRNPSTERATRPWQGEATDAFAEAAHLTLTPILFGLLGALLDRAAGTRPLLMLVLGGLAFVGAFVSTYLRYQARIASDEEGRPWAHRR